MRQILRPALWAVVGTAAFSLMACNKGGETTLSPDEQAIRDLNTHWQSIINNHDANGSAAMYAEDGGIYAPNSPPAVGHEAVLATWTNLTQLPNMSVDLHTNKITVSGSKDMAIEIGTYALKTGDVNAPSVENGKYVVTWIRRDNQWKVYTDMFSSDTAPPPPKPAAESMTMPAPSILNTDTVNSPNALPGAASTMPAEPTGVAAPNQPAATSPSEQAAPVQQFGPASPIQNAAPLMPNGASTNSAPPAPSSSPTPSAAPSAPQH